MMEPLQIKERKEVPIVLEGFCSDRSSLLTCAQSCARQRVQKGKGSDGTCHTAHAASGVRPLSSSGE